jgi:dethiobiotin synthetase
MLLKGWTGITDAVEEIAPFCFTAPLAPLIAAELEGRTLALDDVVECVRALAARHDALIVEGAGGLLVPVGVDWTIGDLARALDLPLLVVARAGLGTVNHTALTVVAARRLGVEPVGVVLNGHGDDSSSTNARLIEQLTGTPVLGRTPELIGELAADSLQRFVEENVDLDTLARLTIPSLEVSRA